MFAEFLAELRLTEREILLTLNISNARISRRLLTFFSTIPYPLERFMFPSGLFVGMSGIV